MSDWNIGDRVVIKPSPNWLQPRRGWAERGRKGTVTFVAERRGMAGVSFSIGVRFDRSKASSPLEWFSPSALLPVSDGTSEARG